MTSATFCWMVSGASRGLGRAIALALARGIPPSTQQHAFLLARSQQGLTETTEQLLQECNQNLTITTQSVDLGDLETLESSLEPLWEQIQTLPSTDHAILINCAGTTGFIGTHPSLKETKDACDLNFTSKVWLSTRFSQLSSAMTTIVNISSMCAIKPTPTMGLYSATSAARDMYHSVLALDSASNNIRILNYAPGSCDTDMQLYLRQHDDLNDSVQAYCRGLEETQSLVDCNDTAHKLVEYSPGGCLSDGGSNRIYQHCGVQLLKR